MSAPNAAFTVTLVRYDEATDDIRAVRTEVFIEEQAVPVPEEWDGLDDDCQHALARDAEGTAIATGRLLPGGKIGRMAVRKPWRARGVGSAILLALMDAARQRGDTEAIVDSQLQAIPFYARHGFAAYGPVFLDAGIEHRKMRCAL